MDQEHRCKVIAWWCSGSTGITKSDAGPNSIHFTGTLSRGGLQGRWAPEELLLASLASCFATTFRHFACDRLVYTRLEVEADGVVNLAEAQSGLNQIRLRAHLTLPSNNNHHLAAELLNKTLAECEVSRALAVPLSLEQDVTVNGTAVVA
jgi:organic hydroperoxide reductase OsmC/OhrA